MSVKEKFLVVGSGSIARRHLNNLKTLFPDGVACCVSNSGRVLSVEEVGADIIFDDLNDAILSRPVMAIIASPSPFHINQAEKLLAYDIPVLIEKPLTSALSFLNDSEQLYKNKKNIDIAYNLRYLPSMQEVKRLVDSGIAGTIYNVMVDVGQYLLDWRPGENYRDNVSAQKSMGGGAVLELSHELDYLLWLFGSFDSAFARLSSSEELGLDVEDRVDAVIFGVNGLVVNLHMDFLQRRLSRTCKIIGSQATIFWDLAKNSVELKGADTEEMIYSGTSYDRNQMYLDEVSAFYSVAKYGAEPLVGLDHSIEVMQLVEALKRSSVSNQVETIKKVIP